MGAAARVFLLGMCAALLGAGWGPDPALGEETRTRLELYSLEGGPLLYEGNRVRREQGGVVTVETEYRKPGGPPLQREVWVYRLAGLELVSQSLVNLASGQREEMERTPGGKVVFRYREKAGEELETDEMTWEPGLAFSAVVGPKITTGWDTLASGGEVAFDFLVVSRQGTVGFRLRKEGMAERDGKAVMVVRMEASNWLIRRLVDPLFFDYTAEAPHRLLEFRGRSSIMRDDGKTQDLRTVYVGGEG